MTQMYHPVSAPIPESGSAPRPKILHIVGDRKMGGVKSTLSGLVQSKLATEFDFTVVSIVGEHSLQQSRQLKPDLIICHHPLRLIVLPHLLALKWLNPQAKILIHEHNYCQGYETYNVRSRLRFHGMLRAFYQLADGVAAISQAQADWLLNHHLVAPHKVFMITQCPPLQAFLEVPCKLPQTPLVLGAYGRLCFHKGFDILLDALRFIPKVPLKVYIAGEGVDEAELKHRTQDLPHVEFVGRQDNVPQFLAQCDVVVIPSRWEAWGNVCLEAKAAGKPVIAAAVDGLVEQVQDCGLLVPPDDPRALAEAIAQVAAMLPSELLTWGQNGRCSVVDSEQHYHLNWQALLRQLAQR